MYKNIYYKINAFVQLLAIIFTMATPVFVFAQGASTPGTGITYECQRQDAATGTTVYGDCGYADLIAAVKRVIDWMIIFVLEFSVVVIVYAGFNYMISGDNPGKRAEANKMLTKVAIGIFFTLAAWLIVNLIASVLLTQAVKNVTPIPVP